MIPVVIALGLIYLALSLYRGKLVTYRSIERANEPRQYWFHVALFCLCLTLIVWGLGGF